MEMFMKNAIKNYKPTVLLFDIETSPNLAYVWGMYEQNVLSFESEWQIISVAWKWLGESKVRCLLAPMGDDSALCKRLHSLLSTADVVVAHNGDDFDIKKFKARAIINKLPPLKKLATVDTLKVARQNFKFNSNKLDDLGRVLGLGQKLKTGGFDLWLGYMKGDPKAVKTMAKYNKRDVVLLEKVYNKLKPWMTNHPSLAALNGNKKGCPVCSSMNVAKWGFRPTVAGIQQRMLCHSCGAYHSRAVGKV